jgi:TRAP-type C4-dicarboxylate transport system permease small subunit
MNRRPDLNSRMPRRRSKRIGVLEKIADSAFVMAVFGGIAYTVGTGAVTRSCLEFGLFYELLPEATVEQRLLTGSLILAILASVIIVTWAMWMRFKWRFPESAQSVVAQLREPYSRNPRFYTFLFGVVAVSVLLGLGFTVPLGNVFQYRRGPANVERLETASGDTFDVDSMSYVGRRDGLITFRNVESDVYVILREENLRVLVLNRPAEQN